MNELQKAGRGGVVASADAGEIVLERREARRGIWGVYFLEQSSGKWTVRRLTQTPALVEDKVKSFPGRCTCGRTPLFW